MWMQALQQAGFTLDEPSFYTACQVLKEILGIPLKIVGCHGCSKTMNQEGLHVLGFPMPSQINKGIMIFVLVSLQSFDPNRLGKFKLDDYISMCIFLQSAKYSHLLPPSAITCIVHIFFELQRKQSRDGFGWGTLHLTYLVWGYRNLFGAFDTSRIGHITLDFNQFVYCGTCLSCLAVSTVKLPPWCVQQC